MQNSFGNFRYDMTYYDAEYFMKKEHERKALRKLGIYTGCAILLSILLQNMIVLAMRFAGLYERYYSDAYFSSAVDILIGVAAAILVLNAFAIGLGLLIGNVLPTSIINVVAGVAFLLP